MNKNLPKFQFLSIFISLFFFFRISKCSETKNDTLKIENKEISSLFISYIDKAGEHDITFVLGDENVTAYGKRFYFEACPEFENNFNDGVVEVDSWISKSSFIHFLKYLLSGKILITPDNIWDLLLASELYKVSPLEVLILREIQNKITKWNVLEIYSKAYKFKQRELLEIIEREWIRGKTEEVFSNSERYNQNYTLPMLEDLLEALSSKCNDGRLYEFFYNWTINLEERGLMADNSFRSKLEGKFCIDKMELNILLKYVYGTGNIEIVDLLREDMKELNYTLSELKNVLEQISPKTNNPRVFIFFYDWCHNLFKKHLIPEWGFLTLGKYFHIGDDERSEEESPVDYVYMYKMVDLQSKMIYALSQQIISLHQLLANINLTPSIIPENKYLRETIHNLTKYIHATHAPSEHKGQDILQLSDRVNKLENKLTSLEVKNIVYTQIPDNTKYSELDNKVNYAVQGNNKHLSSEKIIHNSETTILPQIEGNSIFNSLIFYSLIVSILALTGLTIFFVLILKELQESEHILMRLIIGSFIIVILILLISWFQLETTNYTLNFYCLIGCIALIFFAVILMIKLIPDTEDELFLWKIIIGGVVVILLFLVILCIKQNYFLPKGI